MGDAGERREGSSGRATRCVLVGDETLVEQCADIARAHGLAVVLIATANPRVAEYADANGIAVVGPGSAAILSGLDANPADVLFSVANRRVLADDVLDRVTTAINFHDGPLPGYAGLNVTTWALLAGEHEHAVTWHVMTSDVDAGEVVATERFPIADDDTAFSLNARCYEAALATFPGIAAAIAAGTLAPRPQEPGETHMFRRHDRPARLLDPGQPAAATARAVRALDLGHRLRNDIGSVRLVLADDVLVVDVATEVDGASAAPPGRLLAVDGRGARIATAQGELLVSGVSTAEGAPAELAEVLARHGLGAGADLPAPDPELIAAVAELEPQLSRDESFWVDRLAQHEPTEAPFPGDGVRVTRVVSVADGADGAALVAAIAVWLSRLSGERTVVFPVIDEHSRQIMRRLDPLVTPPLAVIDVDPELPFAHVREAAGAELDTIARRTPLLRDAVGRDPRTRGRAATGPVIVELAPAPAPPGPEAVRITITEDEVHLDLLVDPVDPAAADRLTEQLTTVLAAASSAPETSAGALPILGAAELEQLDAINRTGLDHDRIVTLDELFRAQVARTPQRPALSAGDETLTYAELLAAVQSLERRLTDLGVGRGDRVGIAVPRGADMVVGVLATLGIGAAYVPLDPTYPIERLEHMVGDAGIAALLAREPIAGQLARPGVQVLDPAAGHPAEEGATAPEQPAGRGHEPADLAYVIYTSGSTGLPKGVMLEHRQVTNFFAAMDEVIDVDPPGVWLAVTSLSFDISVLELLWTLTRGFHVVLKSGSGTRAPLPASPARDVTFSLFYFAAGQDAAAQGYHLLLESARFADRHGFEAIWTPERHFHAFGGAYPNPSVTSAAVAAVTSNVGIRAGSVVLPLHSPVRVAEEWAVVDNLSRGRVAISFAAGWQPNDFVLNPSAYANAKEALASNIEVVQRLWRGETVTLPGHDGSPVDVTTLPRPVQAELPVWLTSAGSPATFERAGTLGANVLTHLLGQSVEQLAANIDRYRAAWTAAGHAGEGRVTLMLHTYLDRDADVAREVAREPLKGYLGTAVGLLRDVASAFPTFAGRGKGTDDLFASLTPEEMDQLLEVAAQRYLGTSGLFGTPDDAARMVEEVSAAGVDEVACLVDFGVDTDRVLASLDLLLEAKAAVDARRRPDAEGAVDAAAASDAVADLIARHGVTHLQCTPSLASMIVADPADRAAVGDVQHLMLGGEALPAALAAEIRDLVPGRFTNMYGPTETTIWSLTYEIDGRPAGVVPIGAPIGNTTIYVLDPDGRRVPVGVLGELHIGGEGVARGYHHRPDLTAERFVDRPGMGRLYATGDLVRILPDGLVEFAGRADNQVKIRGHRIELGEIEAVIDRHAAVVQSVVVAREDRGDTRLVAFVVLHDGAAATSDELRQHVGDVLPEAMVPAVVVPLDEFPLTPNGKIDRKALPAATAIVAADTSVATAPPADDTERLVADVWSSELERAVGRDDNFFDIGGHSLLAVKVFRRLTDATGAPLHLTDVFRFPTVRTFAAHVHGLLDGDGAAAAEQVPAATTSGTDRGALRRRALARRGGHEDGTS